MKDQLRATLRQSHPEDLRVIAHYIAWVKFRRRVHQVFYQKPVHWIRPARKMHWV